MLKGYCEKPESSIGCLGNGFYSNGAMLIASALLPQYIYTSYDIPAAGSYICSIITHFSVFLDTIFISHVAVPDSRLPILTMRDSGV